MPPSRKDNRALDRLSYMAKCEGPESVKWLSSVRRDEVQIGKLLDNYWAAMGGKAKWKGGQKPVGNKWSVKEYKETVLAETRVSKESQGKMMWEREFVDFLQSVPGGKYSETEA